MALKNKKYTFTMECQLNTNEVSLEDLVKMPWVIKIALNREKMLDQEMTMAEMKIQICHQWNNEYNYMVLEYFATCYPVLHNASDWKDFGYYYKNSDIAAGIVFCYGEIALGGFLLIIAEMLGIAEELV
jgi:hypothetical protein